jgi:glycosyltransferase involved in cell wall biosynthesis
MRLVFVARAYWPAIGGVEGFVRLLGRELAKGHEVTVLAQRVDSGESNRLTDTLAPPPSFSPFRDGDVRVAQIRVPRTRRAMLSPLIYQVTPGLRRHAFGRNRIAAAELYARVVAPVIAEQLHGADAVHVFGGDLMKAAAVRAARQARVPVSITPFVHPRQWGDDPASALVYRRADRVIGLLEADAEVCRRLGVPPDRIAICGICSPALREGGGAAIRERFDVGGPIVLFLGARRGYKGEDILLRATPLVSRAHPDAAFVFVGPGPALPRSAGDVRVIDAGVVDDDERAAWLEAASMVCLPSEAEIFPTVFLEAWSLKTPVVTSDLPPLGELIDSSGGGLAVPRDPERVGRGILELLDHPETAKRMGEAGHAFWQQRHTPAAVARWHEALYADLAARAGEAAR